MNSKKNFVRTACLLGMGGLVVFGTGCGGLGASGSVSPATFFLPGIGQVEPQNSASPSAVTSRNSPEIASYSGELVR